LPPLTALGLNRDVTPSKRPIQEIVSFTGAPELPIQPPPQLIGLLEKDPFAFAAVILIVPTLAVHVENRIRVVAGPFSELVLVSGRENEILAENAQLTEPGAAPRK